MRFLTTFICAVGISFTFMAHAAKVESYLPQHDYQSNIIKPEQLLGFGLGERHVRHDQLVRYMELVAEQSDRVLLTDIGYTQEMRRQILVTITHPDNQQRLPELLAKKDKGQDKNDPLVVWLGYSVHGDEITGSNASLAIAYYLAASTDADVQQLLKDTVIVLEPSLNPDGMDRFTTWVNTHRGSTPNPDPNHIEHHQDWRTGRTNHFGFDMNRDWLLLSQQETQNRMRYYHQYQPHVLGDYHEMGANSTYFFQPGIPTRTHPLTPKRNTELTQLIATFHAAALNKEDRLYYSQESFDDFYYGKGSTYPDINGGIGILFEQASSRGFQQESINGLLTFEYGIKNHVLTSISTIEGAWKNQEQFKDYRKKFYQDAVKAAENAKFSGYLISEANDTQRLHYFLDKLQQHQIKVYPLNKDFKDDGKVFAKESSFYVPLAQKQYRVIEALFGQGTNFQDNTFYDVSGWTMPLAMDLNFHKVTRSRGLSVAEQTWQAQPQKLQPISNNAYAYAFEWHHLKSPKLMNQLLANGFKARVATKSFSSNINGKSKAFKAGTIVLPAELQQQGTGWRKLLAQHSEQLGIEIFSLDTGLTIDGIDLGSSSMVPVNPVKVLMVGGKGSSQYEVADILFYLDDMMGIPVTVVEQARLSRIDFDDYTHVLLVDGGYSSLSKNVVSNLKTWVRSGGVIFGQKRATRWLAKNEILKAEFVSAEKLSDLFDTEGLTYKDKEKLSARKRIAGAIYESKLDVSHPLAYGFGDSQLPLFRNSTVILEQAKVPFISVANYTEKPLMSGYSDTNLVNQIANNPAVIAHNVGGGRVVATTDVLSFRGYWIGSARLLSNTLFFSKAFSASAN